MLNAINSALQSLLNGPGGIHPLDVDICFEVPTEEWISSLTRPTVSFFLHELSENTEKRDTAPRTTLVGGRGVRRMPPRRIDLFYMVSILTADVTDEHALLWRVTATLLRHGDLPSDVLPTAIRDLEPSMSARLASAEERPNLIDLWSALGTKPRPAVSYVLTAPMDLGLSIDAPLVLTRTMRYRAEQPAAPAYLERVQIGGIVRDTTGRGIPQVTVTPAGYAVDSVTDEEGRYRLQGLSPGRIVLQVSRDSTTRSVEFIVPSDSYDIVLDAVGTGGAVVT